MKTSLLTLFLLASCTHDIPKPPPATSSKAGGELANATWQFQYSSNIPITKLPSGFSFDFPSRDGAHYLVTGISGLAPGKTDITLQYDITGTGTFVALDNQCDVKPGVSLYFQRRGDDLSGQGAYEYYRFWSRPAAILAAGPGQLTVPLIPDQWLTVLGKSYDLSGALNDLQAIGMTFGGCFKGHGVYSTTPAKFTVKSYLIR